MKPDRLVQSLGVALGLPDLHLDESGCARLEIKGAPAVNFESDDHGGLHLYSVLAELPKEGREALFLRLLEGNLFGVSTAGASLAVDTEFGQIALCRTIQCESTSAHVFAAEVEAFVLAAEDWQSRLAEPAALATGREEAPATFVPQSLMGQFLRA